jgi:AAHS family 4-hydroxybenzoate transporter-like MFS transporter
MLIAKETEVAGFAVEFRASVALVIVSFVLVMIDGYDMFIVSFLAPLIAADLDLTPVTIGQVFAAGLAGSMIGGLILGSVADRIGRRPTLIASLVLAGTATILCATATTFASFAALRFIAGFGLGGVLAAVIPLLGEHFPAERRNVAVTLMFVGYPFGAVVGGTITAMVIGHGWRNLFVGTGIVTFLVIIAALWLKEPVKELSTASGAGEKQSVLASLKGLFAEGRLWATLSMAVGVFCMLLVTYLLNSWTPMIAVRSGVAPGMAALCGVFLNLGGIIGALLSTLLVRSFGLFKLVAVMITGGALAIAALGQLHGSIVALLCGLFVAGALAIGGQQNTPAMAVQLYPQRMRAAGAGWQFAVGRLGSILGPIIGGHLVASDITPQTMFVVVAIPTLLAAVAYAAVDYVRPK